jgi:hypothetical protein
VRQESVVNGFGCCVQRLRHNVSAIQTTPRVWVAIADKNIAAMGF